MRLIGGFFSLAGLVHGGTNDQANMQQVINVADYDGKWQTMGACGIPSVQADREVITGISNSIWDLVAESQETEGKGVRGGGNMMRGTRRMTLGAPEPQSAEDKAMEFARQTPRIVGGQISDPDTWPWQVHLTICGRWYGFVECNVCGASIISSRWLISAAHCVPESPSGYAVYGTNDLRSDSGRRGTLKEFFPHPGWDVTNFDNDLALVRPLYQMYISKSSTPICLPHPSTCWDEHTPCVVTGWGLLDERATEFPTELRQVAVRLITKERCERFSNYDILTDNMMCAGHFEGGQDACAGDSGGPLVCRIPKTEVWVLAGTVSWGYGCARPNAPGVYTNLKEMVGWVSDFTREYAEENSWGSELIPDSKLEIDPEFYKDSDIPDSESVVNRESMCFKTSQLSEQAWEDRDMQNIIDAHWAQTHQQLKSVKEAIQEAADASHNTAAATGNDNSNTGLGGTFVPLECRGTISGGQHNFTNTLHSMIENEGIESVWNYEGTITSLNFPEPYPNRANCEYFIENFSPDAQIQVMIPTVQLDCRKRHYIIVTDAVTQKQKKVCRTRRPLTFMSAVGFYIQFSVPTSNSKFKGYELTFSFIDSTHVCPEARLNQIGSQQNRLTFKTPGYPKPYDSLSQCRWHFNNSDESDTHQIVFDFLRGVRTEKSVPCGPSNDNIILFEANDCSDDTLRNAEIWGSLCGYLPKRQIYKFKSTGICAVWLADDDTNRNRGLVFNVYKLRARGARKNKRAGKVQATHFLPEQKREVVY